MSSSRVEHPDWGHLDEYGFSRAIIPSPKRDKSQAVICFSVCDASRASMRRIAQRLVTRPPFTGSTRRAAAGRRYRQAIDGLGSGRRTMRAR